MALRAHGLDRGRDLHHGLLGKGRVVPAPGELHRSQSLKEISFYKLIGVVLAGKS